MRHDGRAEVPLHASSEPLEPRLVLSHELAIVGLSFDAVDGYSPYAAEVTWADDRSVSGDVLTPGPDGPAEPVPTPISDLINGPGGALRAIFGSEGFDRSIGSRLAPSGDYPAGWLLGGMDDGSSGEFAFVVERSSDVSAADLVGEWLFQFTRVTDQGVFTYHSQVATSFNAGGGFFALARGASGGTSDPLYLGEAFQYVGDPEQGRFRLLLGNGGDEAVFYVSRDESVVLFADLDESDGDAWMGVLVRPDADATLENAAGSFRVGVLADGAGTTDLLGGPVGSWRVDLDDDGTFEVFDLDGADRGDPGEALLTGTWTLSGGVATLTDAEGELRIGLLLSANGASAQLTSFSSLTSGTLERPMGFVSRIAPDADVDDTTLVSGILGEDGEPLVFDLRLDDDSWTVADLGRFTFGEAPGEAPEDVRAFQASDGRVIAAVSTPDGLFAIERDRAGFWRGANLTADLDGAEPVVGSITVFTDKTGVSHVAGVTDAGEVVLYSFDPDGANGEGEWAHSNLSAEHLTPQGEATPQFVGPIISYVTDWNGLNIAGLDSAGNIQAVWSGNGGREWHAADLTAITRAPAMTSGLTAYLTSWGGINIVGLDGGGRVVATWWIPSFRGDWRQADLTTASGGPVMTGASLTSFVAPWGGLNIAGLDANGDVVAYWWSPATENDGRGWEFANLTGAIPEDEPRPAEQLQSQTNTSHGGEMNILGTDAASGDLLRLFFRVEDGAWAVENVTEEAAYA